MPLQQMRRTQIHDTYPLNWMVVRLQRNRFSGNLIRSSIAFYRLVTVATLLPPRMMVWLPACPGGVLWVATRTESARIINPISTSLWLQRDWTVGHKIGFTGIGHKYSSSESNHTNVQSVVLLLTHIVLPRTTSCTMIALHNLPPWNIWWRMKSGRSVSERGGGARIWVCHSSDWALLKFCADEEDDERASIAWLMAVCLGFASWSNGGGLVVDCWRIARMVSGSWIDVA